MMAHRLKCVTAVEFDSVSEIVPQRKNAASTLVADDDSFDRRTCARAGGHCRWRRKFDHFGVDGDQLVRSLFVDVGNGDLFRHACIGVKMVRQVDFLRRSHKRRAVLYVSFHCLRHSIFLH